MNQLVKRSDKLEEVKRILLSSKIKCVVIEGDEGVGKSCFLQTLYEDLRKDHFVILQKIAHTEHDKIHFVLGELVFKLEDEIKIFSHWSAKKEKVIEATESILKWIKIVLKIPDEIPVEKIPSYLGGIEWEKYDRSFINEFRDMLKNLIKYVPDDKKMVLMLDQLERIDPQERNLIYDIMEGLPERTLLIFATEKTEKPILTSEVQEKVHTKFITLKNFNKKETEEMLKPTFSRFPVNHNLF